MTLVSISLSLSQLLLWVSFELIFDNFTSLNSHLTVLGSHPVRLPDRHVADELAHVLHVVDVLGEQVALHLQPVRI